MSEAYEQFAKETYATVYRAMKQALEKPGAENMPILVFSGEAHGNLEEEEENKTLPDALEEPAFAAAYTHIAVTEAATRLVRKENIIASFECDDRELKERLEVNPSTFLELFNSLGIVLSQNFAKQAFAEHMKTDSFTQAVKFIKNSGISTVSSDKLFDTGTFKERTSLEILTLGQLALLRPDQRPQIIVHMGGAGHMRTLQGYPFEENKNEIYYNQKTRDKALNPFEGIYKDTLFINSNQPTPAQKRFTFYSQNPKNALQIDAPGKMDENDKDTKTIVARIKAAAEEMELERSLDQGPRVPHANHAATRADSLPQAPTLVPSQ